MSDLAIEVDGLWKKFQKGELHDSLRDLLPAVATKLLRRGPATDELAQRQFWALRDVSFQLERGRSLGIIGPNGAGKSTLFKVLSRVLRPTRGSYRVNGRLSSLIEIGAGFHGDLTGRENIYLNGAILGMKRAEIRSKEEQIVDFAGIREFIDTPVKRYSSGMGARLGFAVAAHMEPDVLLVDEVLSVGDARFREKCIRHMTSLLQSGITVIFVSHILDQVKALCQRTLVLNQGTVTYDGATETAIRHYLDLLSAADLNDVQECSSTRVGNIRLCDASGNEVLEWRSGQPGLLEFDFELGAPFIGADVLVKVFTLDGRFLGMLRGGNAPAPRVEQQGRHQMRFTLDPVPLAAGDYALEIHVFAWHTVGIDGECVWQLPHPRTFQVRGGDIGGIVELHGKWESVQEQGVSDAPTDAGPQFRSEETVAAHGQGEAQA